MTLCWGQRGQEQQGTGLSLYLRIAGERVSREQDEELGASQGLGVRWLRESCEKIPSPGL